MNWKRFGRKVLWPSSGTILTFCMEGLRKTLKDLRMSVIRPKIWTRHLQNTSLDHHTAQTVLV